MTQTWTLLHRVNPQSLWQGSAMKGRTAGSQGGSKAGGGSTSAARSWNAHEDLVWAQRQQPWPDGPAVTQPEPPGCSEAEPQAEPRHSCCHLARVGPAIKLKTSSQGRAGPVSHLQLSSPQPLSAKDPTLDSASRAPQLSNDMSGQGYLQDNDFSLSFKLR